MDLLKADHRQLVQKMFNAKDVPWDLLKRIDQHREFHRPDWPSVEQSVLASLQPFDFYVEFVVRLANQL